MQYRQTRLRMKLSSAQFECLEARQLFTATAEWISLVDPGVTQLEDVPNAEPAILLPSGNANNDAASLLAAGGPADPTQPGWSNVARSGNSGTVVYLGSGWALTANHVPLAASILLAGTSYTVDTSSVVPLKNPNGTTTDLKMFRINGRPDLPELYSSYLATAPPSGHVFMIGNGSAAARNAYWSVNKLTMPWTWTETAQPPAHPGNNDYAGVVYGSSRTVRWGENTVEDVGLEISVDGRLVHGFTTQFDSLPYTGQAALANEAQAAGGDSGGAVFSEVEGKWVLSGIMIAVSSSLSGQPNASSLYGSFTFVADLSVYRNQILSIIGVADRHIFYNGSVFDGGSAAAEAADDQAIAPDKDAYLPGSGLATSANMTNYTRGINGIMIDLVSSHGDLTADDFVFKVGNSSSPADWLDAPAPTEILVRPGAGVGGSDRVEIVWADRAIINRWLRVVVRGNDQLGGFNTNTGLAKSDVFYWGNLIADSGTSPSAGTFDTSPLDSVQIFAVLSSSATITNPRDYNRDGQVTPFDSIVVFSSIGSITRLDLPAETTTAATVLIDPLDDDISTIATSLAALPGSLTTRSSDQPPAVAVDRALSPLGRALFAWRLAQLAHEIEDAEDDWLAIDLPSADPRPNLAWLGMLSARL